MRVWNLHLHLIPIVKSIVCLIHGKWQLKLLLIRWHLEHLVLLLLQFHQLSDLKLSVQVLLVREQCILELQWQGTYPGVKVIDHWRQVRLVVQGSH